MSKLLVILAVLSTAVLSVGARVPGIPMANAAVEGLIFPGMGLGTGGGGNASKAFGEYPECWSSCDDAQCMQANPPSYQGCPEYVEMAVVTFLQLGGRRIDSADSYHNQRSVARGMVMSGVPREEIFLATKCGADLRMGYNDTLLQFANILKATNLTYVDMLSLHWPSCETGNGCNTPPSEATTPIDPICDTNLSVYNESQCRLNSYMALLAIFDSGGARAIGVSNFNVTHLKEIEQAGLRLPAANQLSFAPYHSKAELELVEYCISRKIIPNSWSPFNRPDNEGGCPPGSPNPIVDPIIVDIGKAHNNATAAQVILAWQWQQQIPANPRSQNIQHIIDNLSFLDFDMMLSSAEMQKMNDLQQIPCDPPYCTTSQA